MKRTATVLALLAVLALQSATAFAYTVSGWTRIYEGIEYATGYVTSPRLMRAFAVRVSLMNPDVGIYASHSNGGSPYEVALQTTPAFLSEHGMEVAVNSCYFDAGLSPNTNIEGLLVSNGSVVSLYQAARGAELRFTAGKIASIVNNGGTAGVYNACSGDTWHLVNGTPLGDNVTCHPRTSAGLTQDEKYMILVCVDGRQPGWSDGATIYDMSLWQQSFGAYNAINFDGGGSTTMVRADVGTVNSPCYGYARSVGASLGVSSAAKGIVGPDSVSWSSSRIDIVTRGAGNDVWHKYWDGTNWSELGSLGGDTRYSPAICSWGENRLDVFYTATDNSMRHRYWDGTEWSPSWTNKGGNLTSAPAAVSWGPDRIDVVARGSDGATIWHTNWNGSVWAAWDSLGGNAASDPAICSWGEGRLDVFYRGTNNHLYHRYYNGTAWSAGWTDKGGNLSSAPAAVSWGPDRIDVFARGSDQSTIWHLYWDTDAWSVWGSLGGSSASSPSASSRGVNRLDVWCRGGNDVLYQNYWTGTAWTGWISRGTYY